jgi:predicted DNA-binding transcriptional regulator AlpA
MSGRLGNEKMADQELITDSQLCEELNVDPRTTLRWRSDGDGPRYVRVGPRRIAYRRADVDAWLAARTFAHRAEEVTAPATRAPATEVPSVSP